MHASNIWAAAKGEATGNIRGEALHHIDFHFVHCSVVQTHCEPFSTDWLIFYSCHIETEPSMH